MDEKTKSNRRTTAVLLSVFAGILLVWDIAVAHNEGKGDTISELLRDLSHRFWILPFMLMGVMGHLFWNKPGTIKMK